MAAAMLPGLCALRRSPAREAAALSSGPAPHGTGMADSRLLVVPVSGPGQCTAQHVELRCRAEGGSAESTLSSEGSEVCVEDVGRRETLLGLSAALLGCNSVWARPAQAARDRRPKNIPEDEYKTAGDGVKYYDFAEGKGALAEKGKAVSVHFDCIYKTLTVVSSRESKLLGGNRVIAQPYEFIVGNKPGQERKRDATDSANGLFSAQAAPKPPRAMYSVVEGMRVGGKRTVIVTPEEGYGDRGFAEIPPGATFTLNLELLDVIG